MGEIWRRKKKMNLEFGAFLVFLADFGIIAHLLSTWSDVVHFIWAFSFEYRGKWMHWVPFFFVPVQIYALKNSWQKFRHRFCPTRDTAFKRSSVSSSFSAFFLINSNNVWRKSAITGNRFVNVFTVHSFSRKFPLGISRYLIRLLYMTPNARYLMPFFQSVVEQELCSWNANINHISSENLFRSIAKAKVKGFKKNQHFLVTVIASHFTSYS